MTAWNISGSQASGRPTQLNLEESHSYKIIYRGDLATAKEGQVSN